MIRTALIEDPQSQTVSDDILADTPPGEVLQDPAVIHILLWQHKRFFLRCRNILRDIDKIPLLQQIDRFHKAETIHLSQKPQGADPTDISRFPVPFTGDLVDLETVMVRQLPFIDCPGFLKTVRLVLPQIFISPDLL